MEEEINYLNDKLYEIASKIATKLEDESYVEEEISSLENESRIVRSILCELLN